MEGLRVCGGCAESVRRACGGGRGGSERTFCARSTRRAASLARHLPGRWWRPTSVSVEAQKQQSAALIASASSVLGLAPRWGASCSRCVALRKKSPWERTLWWYGRVGPQARLLTVLTVTCHSPAPLNSACFSSRTAVLKVRYRQRRCGRNAAYSRRTVDLPAPADATTFINSPHRSSVLVMSSHSWSREMPSLPMLVVGAPAVGAPAVGAPAVGAPAVGAPAVAAVGCEPEQRWC